MELFMEKIFDEFILAMQHDANGEWDKAHGIVQNIEHPTAYQIHAYLHRKEGDLSNAHYWYQRAKAQDCDGDLDIERENIMNAINQRY